jgi:hypothetical protein
MGPPREETLHELLVGRGHGDDLVVIHAAAAAPAAAAPAPPPASPAAPAVLPAASAPRTLRVPASGSGFVFLRAELGVLELDGGDVALAALVAAAARATAAAAVGTRT